MLARIQQFIAAALLATLVAACTVGASTGRPWLGPAWAAATLACYAGVLAVEFAMLCRSYAPNDALRPRLLQLIRAWAAESTAAPRVFLWRQPFRSRAEPDHLPTGAQGRRGVLLVHGFFCNRGIWNAWLRRLRARGTPYVAVDLEPVFGSIDDYRGIIASAERQLQSATGVPPIIVAHSMGGLAARAWLAGRDDAPLHRLVTIATPHAGTRLGEHGHGKNTAQMRMGSPWLGELSRGESAALRRRFVCFWSHCDNIVFPTRNATLSGAENRHLEVTPHVHMVDHPEVFAAVVRLLDEAD